MVSENLDLVRSIYADWERGDSVGGRAHSEIELVYPEGPSPGTRTGLAGLAEGWREWLSAWENYRVEADEYRELDEQRVLVLSHYSGRGSKRPRGRANRTDGATLFHVRDGKVTTFVGYRYRAVPSPTSASRSRATSEENVELIRSMVVRTADVDLVRLLPRGPGPWGRGPHGIRTALSPRL